MWLTVVSIGERLHEFVENSSVVGDVQWKSRYEHPVVAFIFSICPRMTRSRRSVP